MNRFASKRVQAMLASVFDTMDRAKARARDRGLEIIDLSIGSSDLPPPGVALEALRRATHRPETYGYCLHTGTGPLRRAVTAWTARRYGFTPDPEAQVLPLIGSQEGFANLLLATTDPGDLILAPDPGYPSYYGAIALAGLELATMPLLERNGYLPDLSVIPADTARRAKVLLISYPNNPTAAVADEAFMRAVVAFCTEHDILLVHDFPYVDMTYGDYRAPSVLTQPGALGTAVELYSASKSFHMGGFRIGWAVGNADALAALARVKGAVDFNQYLGIQQAAVAALEGAEADTRGAAKTFEARRDALVETLNTAGWPTPLPQASMYVWTRLPRGVGDSFAFALALAEATGVCLAPGRAFGEEGEGYVRFALVRSPAVLARAAAQIQSFLQPEVR
jgi:aspartate/methionine/tyrosine aminotransferase